MWWVLAALGLVILGGKKVTEEVNFLIDRNDFLKKVSAAALPVSKESGIPLSIIVTQAAHESNYGNSQLAQKSNNLFGIKANASWVGPADVYPTHETINGKDITVQAAFRKYSTWEGSIRDWLKFIQGPRYVKAYAAAVTGNSALFFLELQKAGYATDPSYAAKLNVVLANIREALA